MSMEESRKPAIRFKGFTDDWEQRKLGEMSLSFEYGLNAAAKEYDGENKYIRITDIDDESHDFKQEVLTSPDTDLSYSESYKLSEGDILFARTGASVGKSYIYKHSDGLVYYAGFLIRARIKSEYNPEFVYQNTLRSNYEKFIKVTSMRSGQPGVNAQEYSQFEIMIPSKAEQDRIASCFRKLDNLITLHQRKYDKLVNIKKSMLEKMFPKDGEVVPEVRFEGFTDDWEQRKFSDITFLAGMKNKENLPLESYSISNEYGFIPQTEQFENGGTMKNADKSMYYIVQPYSFAYNPARINVGSIGYYNKDENVIVSSLYEVFKTTQDVNDRFLWHWFKSDVFQRLIEQYQEGGVRLYFYYDKLCKCSIELPSVDEQNKIGQVLDKLDNIITLHQRKLEKLQNIKKSMLEKMFV